MVRIGKSSRKTRRMAVLAGLASVGALLSGLLSAVPASASTIPVPLSPGYKGAIIGYQGLCLDDRGDNLSNFNPVQLYECNNTAAQDWWVVDDDGYYEIHLSNTGYCLDANRGGLGSGTFVQLYQCNTSPAQDWGLDNGGVVESQRSGSGACLDDPNFATDGSSQLQLWSCNGGQNQQWIGQVTS